MHSLNSFFLKLCHSLLIPFFLALNKKKSFQHQICMLEAVNVALRFLHFCIDTILISGLNRILQIMFSKLNNFLLTIKINYNHLR